ncbi:MAG: DUF2652 domain-containing protein [Bacteroidota bacterium]
MPKSLLFIPDISGYTKFIQTTEVEHSQHVISELLEVLLAANEENLKLAEIEGDALFFYKENEILSQERLLAQIESMFTAFYSHLKLLEKNRICPCNACATAPNLQLKVIAHIGELQHIEVQGIRKPFGEQVIEAHRLLKNTVDSDNYALVSRPLALEIQLSHSYFSNVFRFRQGADSYDGKTMEYLYAIIDPDQLDLRTFTPAKKHTFTKPPNLLVEKTFNSTASRVMEYITNYSLRPYWAQGVDTFEFNKHEVTRMGTEHACVINGKHLNFVTVVKEVEKNQLVYGELTTSLPIFDELYQFFIITPKRQETCLLQMEVYWKVQSPFKKMALTLFAKNQFKKSLEKSLQGLYQCTTAQKMET